MASHDFCVRPDCSECHPPETPEEKKARIRLETRPLKVEWADAMLAEDWKRASRLYRELIFTIENLERQT